MFQLPEYFTEFHSIMAEPLIEILVTIENQFEKLNYQDHKDNIANVFTDHEHFTGKNSYDVVLSIYREHIDYVLSYQGIFLKDPYYERLSLMAMVLTAVASLAIQRPSELSADFQNFLEDSNELFFAQVVEALTDQSWHETVNIIDSITDTTIELIRGDHELPHILSSMTTDAQNRFKQSPLEKTGIVVDLLKVLNYFGYNLQTILIAYGEVLSNITSSSEIAKEVMLLVLASDTPERLLLQTMLNTTDQIIDNATVKLSINAEITRFMELQREKA